MKEWCYGQPLQIRMTREKIYDLDKTHTLSYVFHQPEGWTPDKEKTWQEYWDKDFWDRKLTKRVQQGYNAVCWLHGSVEYPEWQSWAIRFEEFPEARVYSPEDTERVIEHLSWIFSRAKQLGLKNYIQTCVIHYSEPFAKAHG